jgi:hypothetical protein
MVGSRASNEDMVIDLLQSVAKDLKLIVLTGRNIYIYIYTKQMCNLIYDNMIEAGIAIPLAEPVHMDKEGNEVEAGGLPFLAYRVTLKYFIQNSSNLQMRLDAIQSRKKTVTWEGQNT